MMKEQVQEEFCEHGWPDFTKKILKLMLNNSRMIQILYNHIKIAEKIIEDGSPDIIYLTTHS